MSLLQIYMYRALQTNKLDRVVVVLKRASHGTFSILKSINIFQLATRSFLSTSKNHLRVFLSTCSRLSVYSLIYDLFSLFLNKHIFKYKNNLIYKITHL